MDRPFGALLVLWQRGTSTQFFADALRISAPTAVATSVLHVFQTCCFVACGLLLTAPLVLSRSLQRVYKKYVYYGNGNYSLQVIPVLTAIVAVSKGVYVSIFVLCVILLLIY